MLTATCSQPTDPVPAMLAPRVIRAEKTGRYQWHVVCEIEECVTRAATKREALEWAAKPSWLHWTAEGAARAGKTCPAPTPASVCFAGSLSPYDPTIEGRPPNPDGGWWACGLGLGMRLCGAQTLARHRLGWSDERFAEATHWDRRWAKDWTTWAEAVPAATADLLAGRFTPEESAVLGATPRSVDWLRLDAFCLGCLQSYEWSPTGEALREFYTPGFNAHDLTCWA